MGSKPRVEEIVLYHGSLEELNGIRQSQGEERYIFAAELLTPSYDHLSFLSIPYEPHTNLEKLKNELLSSGYDGLVNRRTIVDNISPVNIFLRTEGTPIVLASRNSKK